MAKTNSHQRGFTLIEMSIVLVIIGLIIGGILKGQELIESARQKNVISQIDALKAGTTTFVDRFKSLPGDYGAAVANIAAGTTNGNEDGNVGAIRGNAAGLATMTNTIASESEQYFVHMLAANLIGGGSATTVATACFSGNCATASPQPSSAFPQSGISIQFGTHEGTAADASTSHQAHWFILSRWSAAAQLGGGPADGVISPARAFQLDNKYDDGLAATGNIRTLLVGASCGGTAATYTATVTAVNCHLAFDGGF